MCGIVGYIGEKRCTPILLHGLKNLEYRGYDSAGIAILENHSIQIQKEKGRVANLESLVNPLCLQGTVGIAHTRWATHGKPSHVNSHPHLDSDSCFAVVHNGIIENYKVLREFLEEEGYTFSSKTDTEVIPNLIHYYYMLQKETSISAFLQAVSSTCQRLEGSYAILAIGKDFPGIEIAVKKDSPLVIGKGNKEFYIASDMPAILEYTRDFYFLEENEMALIEKERIAFFDANLKKHEKLLTSIPFDALSSTKRGYEDFMLKEIYEQPEAIRRTIANRIQFGKPIDFSDISFSKKELTHLHQIYIVACGTAMHAGFVGKQIIEKLCHIPTHVEIASEFRYGSPFLSSDTLCIFVSQSGETADTIAGLRLAKEKGAKTLAISNVIGSSITREADQSIYTYAGPEIAVASTKAYTCQIALLCLFALYLSELRKTEKVEQIEDLKRELFELPEKLEEILQKHELLQNIANQVYQETDMFFLGRGIDYYVALEGSLKLKEISYLHSEAYPAGELKHGPIALIEEGTIVIGILTQDALLSKTISNLQEVITRGAKVIAITMAELPQDLFEFVFKIPTTNSYFSPLLSIVPLQLLSYYVAKEKNLDVDKPRNLAKSVTVE